MGAETTAVRRRTVFYIEGYDPRGPGHYHGLYRDEAAKQAAVNGVALKVGPRRKIDAIQSGWDVTSDTTETRYVFLRYDDIMRARWPKTTGSLLREIARYTWAFATRGVYAGMWRHFKPILFFGTAAPMLVLILVLAALAGGLVAGAFGGLAVGLAVTAVLLAAAWLARPRIEKYLAAFWIARICAFCGDQGLGRTPDMDQRIIAFADRIRAEWETGAIQELLVVGHSIGSQVGVEVLARVLENPASGAARLSFLSLGQTIPLVGFQPPAEKFRRALQAIAADPRLDWVDVSARADGLCFPQIDPLRVCGIAQPDPARPRPRLVSPRYHTMFDGRTYRKMKRDFYRTHFQYLMATEKPGQYDYFLITAGPRLLGDRFKTRGDRAAPATP